MAVEQWLQNVRNDVAAGVDSVHAFIDNVIQELHKRKDDPEEVGKFIHNLNNNRHGIADAIMCDGTADEEHNDGDSAGDDVASQQDGGSVSKSDALTFGSYKTQDNGDKVRAPRSLGSYAKPV